MVCKLLKSAVGQSLRIGVLSGDTKKTHAFVFVLQSQSHCHAKCQVSGTGATKAGSASIDTRSTRSWTTGSTTQRNRKCWSNDKRRSATDKPYWCHSRLYGHRRNCTSGVKACLVHFNSSFSFLSMFAIIKINDGEAESTLTLYWLCEVVLMHARQESWWWWDFVLQIDHKESCKISKETSSASSRECERNACIEKIEEESFGRRQSVP